jgi:nitrite reductase (NADH) small subunit
MTTLTKTEVVLGSVEQIPYGEGREFEAGGKLIAVFRSRDGRVYATQAKCPHREGPLADGLIGGSEVICPFHAWKFDLLTGEPKSETATCGIETYAVDVGETGIMTVSV